MAQVEGGDGGPPYQLWVVLPIAKVDFGRFILWRSGNVLAYFKYTFDQADLQWRTP